MKSIINYFSLSMLAVILLFSACRKDNRPAELNTDTNKIVFIKGEMVKYFGIVNTGTANMDYQITSSESYVNVSPSVGTLGFNGLAKIQVTADLNQLGYGVHTANLTVNSNGGTRFIDVQIYKPLPNPAVLWWDIDYIKIINSSNRDYITLRNDGEEVLSYSLSTSSSWMSFSNNDGFLEAGQDIKIWVNVDRSGLNNDLYSGTINVISSGGNAQIDVDMEVGVYTVSFFNPTYTDIDINVPGQGSQTIPVLNRVSYVYNANPGSIFYQASTKGETINNQVLGIIINWTENINLNSEESPIFDLNISNDFFFLSAKNYGSHDLDQWSINYDTDFQFDEDVSIPNDGQEYYFGYYDALDKSNVYARIVGTGNDAIWENGKEFDFTWTLNQSILLESSLKSTGVKSNRSFKNTFETPAQLKLTPNSRKAPRVRNSVSVVNTSASR
jgi:hypothetical protein